MVGGLLHFVRSIASLKIIYWRVNRDSRTEHNVIGAQKRNEDWGEWFQRSPSLPWHECAEQINLFDEEKREYQIYTYLILYELIE